MGGNAGNGQGDAFKHMYASTNSNFPTNQTVDGWNLGDPFDVKAAECVAFCFAGGAPRSPNELHAMARLKEIMTATNIKRYLHLFRTHFNGHWPVIHMPTFSTQNANNGLLLAMACIGAIYSNDMSLEMERWLMVMVKNAAGRTFRTLNSLNINSPEHDRSYLSSLSDIEEIQALMLVQCMFVWHGDVDHRQHARDDFRSLLTIAQQCGLTRPIPPGQQGHSILHQSHRHNAQQLDLSTWDWNAWVIQEQRNRVMMLIYLTDCAMAMYFNCPPQFTTSEIQIQLPADDAAWEAHDRQSCMDALGLNGQAAQLSTNSTGSQRYSQPEFHVCIKLLLSQQSEFAPRTTNVFSKFILIHALHAGIWNLYNSQSPLVNFQGPDPSTPGTPLVNYDWVSGNPISNPGSGRATPIEGQQHQLSQINHQHIQALKFALEKWKRAWEMDLDIQYPPTGSPSGMPHIRRIGFCRDAVHYYWLAKQFLQNPRTSFNLQAGADQRLCYVMGMLKQIRTYVANEGFKLGKELGSITEIDENFAASGVDMLSLNMKQLFVALPEDTAPLANPNMNAIDTLLR